MYADMLTLPYGNQWNPNGWAFKRESLHRTQVSAGLLTLYIILTSRRP